MPRMERAGRKNRTSYKVIYEREGYAEDCISFSCIIGNFVPYDTKTLREDAHSHKEVECRRRLCSARECALHILLKKDREY